MKKKYLKKVVFTILMIIGIISVCFLFEKNESFADSGFSTSHSSSHSSSSSSHSSSSSSYSSGSGSTSGAGVIFTIILYLVIWLVERSLQRKADNNKMSIQKVNDTDVENKIKNVLPDFDKSEFLKQGFEIYTDIQNAWMNFELDKVRDKITDELYSMYESQLTTLEIKGEQNIMKNMVNKYSFLKDVSVQNNVITITAGYYIEQYDYIADINTKKLIRGESNKKMRVKYEMKFRKIINDNESIDKCPNCGAKMDINSGGICEYCGSKVVSENSKWVLTEKKVLIQYYI